MNTKYCPTCRKDVPVDDWHRNRAKPDGLQSRCKACMKQTTLEIYHKKSVEEKHRYNKNTKNNVIGRNKQYVISYLQEHHCVDCGESDIVVLEFDHVRGKKKFGIATASMNKVSLKKLKNEIKKCDVRCANCHRRKTAIQRGWYRTQV